MAKGRKRKKKNCVPAAEAEALFDRRLRAVCAQTGPTKSAQPMDKAEFAYWLERNIRRHKTRERRHKLQIAMVAMAFLCVFACVGTLAIGPCREETVAKLKEAQITRNDQNVMIGGNSENIGNSMTIYRTLNEVPEKHRREMLVFTHVPFDLALEQIEVKIIRDKKESLFISYLYGQGALIVKVKQGEVKDSLDATILNGDGQQCEINGITVSTLYRKQKYFYQFCIHDRMVTMIAKEDIHREEIEAMIASIKIGWNKS